MCYGLDLKQVKEKVRQVGDYGDVAVALRQESQNSYSRWSLTILTLNCIVDAA